MADTPVAAGLTVQNWDSKFFKEYLEANRFKKEMGTSSNNIIQLKEDLTKKKGDSVTFALVNRLSGAGVTGSNTLEWLTCFAARHCQWLNVKWCQKSKNK